MSKIIECWECRRSFVRYNMNRTRAARPQFCSVPCRAAHMRRLADIGRLDRFWKQVDKTGDCWVWTGYRDNNGYGKFQYARDQSSLAHRYAYELKHGAFNRSLFVCHKCDNPPCCNPDHLFLGTAKDNMADAAAKGRMSRVPTVRGSEVNTSKLTKAQAVAIYHSAEPGTILAARYGVSSTAIYFIKGGRNWAWATGANNAPA